MNKRDYVIYNQSMAGWMMWKGCKLLKMKPNKQDSSKFVYYFPETDYVLERVNEYLNNQRK